MIEPLVNGLRNSATPAKISNIISEQTVELDASRLRPRPISRCYAASMTGSTGFQRELCMKIRKFRSEGDTGTRLGMRWFAEKQELVVSSTAHC